MTTVNDYWREFLEELTSSSLTEEQKCWLLLKLQSILMKEIDASQKTIVSINTELEKNRGMTTKPEEKHKAEKEAAQNYKKGCLPLQDYLNRRCKEIIAGIEELTATEQKELKESIDSSHQCDNPNTRKKIHKLLCGFAPQNNSRKRC